jgi:ribosomal protein L37AE/L43A
MRPTFAVDGQLMVWSGPIMAGAAHPRESSGASVWRLGVKRLGRSGKALDGVIGCQERLTRRGQTHVWHARDSKRNMAGAAQLSQEAQPAADASRAASIDQRASTA